MIAAKRERSVTSRHTAGGAVHVFKDDLRLRSWSRFRMREYCGNCRVRQFL